ncbi:MAG: hypothetical protein JWR09_5485 [Mucilaginibacter sp.]|nr:hypothetical protein [Mucilaginibacter sp.]
MINGINYLIQIQAVFSINLIQRSNLSDPWIFGVIRLCFAGMRWEGIGMIPKMR